MNAPADHNTAIAALRSQGAEGFDPVRFCFIEALARRAQAHTGDARRLLDGRLTAALKEYGERFAQQAGADITTPPAGTTAPTPLAELAAYLAQHSTGELASAPTNGLAPATAAAPAPAAELKSVRYFRDTWAKLSVDQQLAEAFAQLPENAGPLNAQLLVLRALERMRDLSPAYLNHFMAYLDALLWLDQANGAGAKR